MDLRGELPKVPPLSYPTGITFGEYQGEIEALKEAVRLKMNLSAIFLIKRITTMFIKLLCCQRAKERIR